MKMKTIACVIMVAISAAITVSCSSDDDNSFKGSNKLEISTVDGVAELIARNNETLSLNLMLTSSLEKDVTLSFAFEDGEVDTKPVVRFTDGNMVIKAGEKTGTLTIEPLNEELVLTDMQIKIVLKSTSDDRISLLNTFSFMLKPRPVVDELTEEQQALLAGYLQRGIDLMHWIGEVPVVVKIERPGDGFYEPFLSPLVSEITGSTIITLSENATAETPVLKMTSNAMGLRGYLYDILRAVTILNNDFWVDTPNAEVVMELTGLSPDSQETFELVLDNIVLKEDGTLDYVSDEALDIWGDEYTAVDFMYTYSAWERLKDLAEKGNTEAIEQVEDYGTLNPKNYLNYTAIDEDGYEVENWFPYTSSYDLKTGKMVFKFPMDHIDASDYMRITVTYGSAK